MFFVFERTNFHLMHYPMREFVDWMWCGTLECWMWLHMVCGAAPDCHWKRLLLTAFLLTYLLIFTWKEDSDNIFKLLSTISSPLQYLPHGRKLQNPKYIYNNGNIISWLHKWIKFHSMLMIRFYISFHLCHQRFFVYPSKFCYESYEM